MAQQTLNCSSALVSAGVLVNGRASVNYKLCDDAVKFKANGSFAVRDDGAIVGKGGVDLGTATQGEKDAIAAYNTAMAAMLARLDAAGKITLGG